MFSGDKAGRGAQAHHQAIPERLPGEDRVVNGLSVESTLEANTLST